MAKIIGIVLIAAVFLTLYLYRLDEAPIHLNQDEAMFALNAKSIAESGRDFYAAGGYSENLFPFYFWHLDNFWATPIITYWTSIFLKFLPFSEASTRVSTVFLGLISVFLLMFLIEKIFKNRKLTVLSGALIATTPAFFINSRLLIDSIYPMPFVFLWLVLLLQNERSKKSLYLFLAGLTLGIGLHSYHAAKIYMPIYFIATLLYGYMVKWLRVRTFLAVLVGFLIPIIAFIPWLKAHPDTLFSQVSYVSSVDPTFANRSVTTRIVQFSKNYLSYFDPKILFIEGDRTLVHSTGKVGVFLFPIVFLLVFGILRVVTDKKEMFGKLILFGFLTFPIAPALINDPGRVSRALVVIPFGILLSVYGTKFLLDQKDQVFRYLIIFVLGSSVLQFFSFLVDYHGDYRLRSRAVFNDDIGGAFESALRSTQIRPVEKIYVDENIFQAKYYFEFYKKKTNIYPNEVEYFDSNKENFKNFSKGSIVVSSQKFMDLGKFEIIETIRELDGTETYFVYFRNEI